jgi:beta-galactosidase
MKPCQRFLLVAIAASCSLAHVPCAGAEPPASVTEHSTGQGLVRERVRIDDGWRFAFGQALDPAKDFQHGTRPFFGAKAGYGDGPAAMAFDDRPWRLLDLPHDWAVELAFDARGSTNHGSKAIGRAFPENSVGWYRRELAIPASDRGRRISLEFDGVFRDSVVWVNGHFMGREASGYSSFRYDITDYLNYGGRNVVAVRVDATGEEGWWYEGAGIYRHVWLTKTGPVHVGHWGTFVHSTVDSDGAELLIDVAVKNDSDGDSQFSLEHQVLDPEGRLVATQVLPARTVPADSAVDSSSRVRVPGARLWSLETPQLYQLNTLLRRGGKVVDRYVTPFAIRTIRFDPKEGFFLNGRPVKLHGVDIHQDHAGVGTAMPDELEAFRLRRLKEMGVNALRSSHNPPAPELLDACDRLGLLVIDEHRVMGTTPQIRDQLERMVRRDRNHPSVILWSVGNEEWAIENTEIGTRLAGEMQSIVRRLDPTRLSTVAVSSSGGPEGTAVGSEVLGFNYEAQHDIDAMHERFPERPSLLTEEGQTTATRGVYVDDPARVHLAAYDRPAGGTSTASIEQAWKFNAARPFLAGMFVWTGFDYRGETTPFGWPAVSSQFGMLDTTGLMKDSGWYLKAAWTTAPVVHLLPHWNWTGREGQLIDVRAYANTDEIDLLLDGSSLGRRKLAPFAHAQWSVPFRPGTLTAKGYRAGRLVAQDQVSTTGPGVSVKLTLLPESHREKADDIFVFDVTVRDAQGRIVPTAGDLIHFSVSGPARLIGMGNGDPGSHEADRPAERHRYTAAHDWRMQGAQRAEQAVTLASALETGSWRDPFQWVPDDQRPPEAAFDVIRARFSRPTVAPGVHCLLFIGDLVPDQRVFINGREIKPQRDGEELLVDLDPAALEAENTLTYLVKTPSGGIRTLIDAALDGARWATLRVTEPAGPWQRSVFNGHAQLIVQATHAGGDTRAIVSATSDGLAAASAQLDSR